MSTSPLFGPMRTARLAGALLRGRALPYSITFILTDRCNFSCTYCNIPNQPAKEMDTAEFCRAIDELADEGMTRASFSGGEVLLRKDAEVIIGHAKSKGLFTSLNTNGWLTVERFEALAPLLDMLVISLDGTEDAHDRVCQKPGSYKRVIEVLELAQQARIATATITVLGPWNLDSIDHVLGVAAKHGAWAYFQPAQEDCYDQNQGLHPAVGSKELNQIADQLQAAMHAKRPVASSAGYLKRLRKGPDFSDCSSCAAGRYFATVLPDGLVVPCHLKAEAGDYHKGAEVGFARAFYEMPHPQSGSGCAISPYQESDLIFSLDPRAITSAFRKLRPSNPSGIDAT